MRRHISMMLLTSIIILTILAACSPKTQPVTPPSPAAVIPITPASGGAPTSNLPPPTSQDAARAKVVEAAKKEGKVNAYAYSWVGDIGLDIAKAFKERYGITVEIVTGRGGEYIERMKTEKRIRQQVADITEGSTVHTNNYKIEGLLVSVVDELPSLREKGVWWVEPTAMDPRDKANLTWRLIVYTPYINTKLVKPNEIPPSWKDMLEPMWKGKIGTTDPRLGSGIYQTIVVLMDQKIWDEDFIRALYRQNLHFYTSQPDAIRALARGETPLNLNAIDGDAARFALEGSPIQAIATREGVLLTTTSVAAVGGGPNPNATRVFLNWLFSPEGQSVGGKALATRMVRKDVPDFRPGAVQAPITKPLVITVEQMEKAAEMFREKWFDKVVGR